VTSSSGQTRARHPRAKDGVLGHGEDLAAGHLVEAGFRVLARNGRCPHGELWLPPSALVPASRARERGILFAGGFDRVLRVARRLAALAGRGRPDRSDISCALGLRGVALAGAA
jgi:hypothetical protein